MSADLIVARSDNTIWELSSSDRLSVSSWTVGDIVVSMPATAFGFDAFLIRYPDLVSIGARFLDNGSQATVTAKTPGSSCTSVTLSTGAEWFACTDKAVLDSIQVGETVSHYNSSSSGVAFLLRLADGKAALVVP